MGILSCISSVTPPWVHWAGGAQQCVCKTCLAWSEHSSRPAASHPSADCSRFENSCCLCPALLAHSVPAMCTCSVYLQCVFAMCMGTHNSACLRDFPCCKVLTLAYSGTLTLLVTSKPMALELPRIMLACLFVKACWRERMYLACMPLAGLAAQMNYCWPTGKICSGRLKAVSKPCNGSNMYQLQVQMAKLLISVAWSSYWQLQEATPP